MQTKEDILAGLLKSWFENAEWDKPHFLHRNKVAILIKKELQRINRWKRPMKIRKGVNKSC